MGVWTERGNDRPTGWLQAVDRLESVGREEREAVVQMRSSILRGNVDVICISRWWES